MATLQTAKDRMARPGVVVELVQGEYWHDDISGIKLSRSTYRMATHEDMKNDKSKNRNIALTGYVKIEGQEDRSTAKLPNNADLSRIEKAIRLGILKIHDPKNPVIYSVQKDDFQRGKADPDGIQDFIPTRAEDKQILDLLKLPLKRFETAVSQIKREELLIAIFNAEYEGRNPLAQVRNAYITTIQKYMKTKREKLILSPITSKVEERVTIS